MSYFYRALHWECRFRRFVSFDSRGCTWRPYPPNHYLVCRFFTILRWRRSSRDGKEERKSKNETERKGGEKEGRRINPLFRFFSSRRRGGTRNEFITSDTRRSWQSPWAEFVNFNIRPFDHLRRTPLFRAPSMPRGLHPRPIEPRPPSRSFLGWNIVEFTSRRGILDLWRASSLARGEIWRKRDRY